MRWICVLFTAGVVVSSPWLMHETAQAQSAPTEPPVFDPAVQIRITPVSMPAVRPLDLDGAPANPIPEPSAIAMVLLGSAFLIRRRRPRLDSTG